MPLGRQCRDVGRTARVEVPGPRGRAGGARARPSPARAGRSAARHGGLRRAAGKHRWPIAAGEEARTDEEGGREFGMASPVFVPCFPVPCFPGVPCLPSPVFRVFRGAINISDPLSWTRAGAWHLPRAKETRPHSFVRRHSAGRITADDLPGRNNRLATESPRYDLAAFGAPSTHVSSEVVAALKTAPYPSGCLLTPHTRCIPPAPEDSIPHPSHAQCDPQGTRSRQDPLRMCRITGIDYPA